ncbi:MAG: type V CRISPR-associated protein Cas4 [Chitinispirillales bacterium]|jgi:CRISPR-associated protein Cas4|nr:type V CRISPR-associated protein Cas4 [Chitinispirillales bacterium]
MENYLSISTLNDFVFCPYSIYLHNVYMAADEELFHAAPQTQGKASHRAIDAQTYSTKQDIIVGLPVFSNEFGIAGKIDIYKSEEKSLIERKHQLNKIYKGQIYQLWAQYFCMTEMGYWIEKLSFYSISANKTYPVNIPSEDDKKEFAGFILNLRNFDPETEIPINENKCRHCVYCNLCDKTEVENVYS